MPDEAVGRTPQGRGRRWLAPLLSLQTIRIACHLAVVSPFLVAAGLEMARGWRPNGDDAFIVFRSWAVTSSHSTLVGQFNAGLTATSGHAVYDPGPLLFWFLTIPVHLDHAQGALWGAAVLCTAGVSLAVEAAWSARGWPAAVAVVAVVLAILAEYPALALDPVWNAHIGLIWFIGTAAIAYAVTVGRLRWWPMLVLAASFAAQCNLVFAAGAVACAVLAPVLGLRQARRPGWWLPVGLLAGVGCWLAPFVQELTSRTGNVTYLLRAERTAPGTGAMFGLRSLSAVVGLHPIWASAADHASFLAIVSTIGANSWVLGIAILVGLLCIWVASTSTGRHDLAALCFVALVLSGTLVLTFSSIPRAQLLYISYLDPASWPVGMIVTLAGLWALAELSVWAARRVAARHRSRRQGLVPSIRALRWFVLGLTAVMGALTVASDTVIAGHSLDDTQVRAEGWPMIPQVASVSARIERVVPRGGVMIVTHSLYGPGVVTGVLWELYSDGWRPKAGHYYGRLIGPEVLASGTAPPVTATVTYTGFSPATVAVSGTRRS
ncbi:MAG: hypothetical protein ABSC00_05985 [Acidimicrobiales bacterium]